MERCWSKLNTLFFDSLYLMPWVTWIHENRGLHGVEAPQRSVLQAGKPQGTMKTTEKVINAGEGVEKREPALLVGM